MADREELSLGLTIFAGIYMLVVLVGGVFALNALINCLYNGRGTCESLTREEKLAVMSMGPTHNFTKGLTTLAGGADDHPECTICLSEFVEDDGIKVLPRCKHGFHVKCIEKWLYNQSSCPTCRTSCLKASFKQNPPVNQQQQNDHVVDVEAANPPETEIMAQQQPQQQQQQQQSTE